VIGTPRRFPAPRAGALALGLALVAPAAAARAQGTVATDAPLPYGQRRVTLAVATRALARGDTLAAADVALRDTVIRWPWNGVSPDTVRPAPGWVVQRPIAAGERLRPPGVIPLPVVRAGTRVTVEYRDGPVRLRLSGIATNSAPLGAPVGVRLDPTRRLDGIAVAPNLVRLK
jgi:flagella basal body P-ring formation protein FlgA